MEEYILLYKCKGYSIVLVEFLKQHAYFIFFFYITSSYKY